MNGTSVSSDTAAAEGPVGPTYWILLWVVVIALAVWPFPVW